MFSIDKFVNSLPSTLEPNSVYAVRSGAGFDLYITTVGAVAIPLNAPGTSALQQQIDHLRSINKFPIWAEENGALSADAFEWSWGNGATGSDIGIPVDGRCELISASFNADVFGTSVSVHINRENQSVELPLFTEQNQVITFANPVVFEHRNLVSFRTGVVNGTFTDARVTAWLRPI